MAATQTQQADGEGQRRSLAPAMLAALWTVSNGKCYAPGCVIPVVLEVRPGAYQKNAQVAHIFGVRPGTPRYQAGMSAEQRDSFANLLLLCLAHHEEVDGADGERRYPPETLRQWKVQHEGANGFTLSQLSIPSVDALMQKLIEIAEPPLNRLEAVTKRLEKTGVVTADTVTELRQIIESMSMADFGISRRTADTLAQAAEALNVNDLSTTAHMLLQASETLNPTKLEQAATSLTNAASMFSDARFQRGEYPF